MKTLTAVLLAVGLIAAGLSYHLGKEAGYSQGWSDGNCGQGQACESGQE